MLTSNAIYERVLEDFKLKRSARIRRQVRNVLRLIALSKDERIAEIGVATGKFSSIISKDNLIYALDISFENLERAQRAVLELGNIKNLLCVQADCAKIPFLNCTFDKVLAIDIIEHLTDENFFLFCKEAYRIVKNNGSFFIYTPNLLHPYELSRPLRPLLCREHIGVRSRATICRCLQENKFVIKKSYFSNFFRRINIEAEKIP